MRDAVFSHANVDIWCAMADHGSDSRAVHWNPFIIPPIKDEEHLRRYAEILLVPLFKVDERFLLLKIEVDNLGSVPKTRPQKQLKCDESAMLKSSYHAAR